MGGCSPAAPPLSAPLGERMVLHWVLNEDRLGTELVPFSVVPFVNMVMNLRVLLKAAYFLTE